MTSGVHVDLEWFTDALATSRCMCGDEWLKRTLTYYLTISTGRFLHTSLIFKNYNKAQNDQFLFGVCSAELHDTSNN